MASRFQIFGFHLSNQQTPSVKLSSLHCCELLEIADDDKRCFNEKSNSAEVAIDGWRWNQATLLGRR